jgi:hypothetical protein
LTVFEPTAGIAFDMFLRARGVDHSDSTFAT